VLALALLSAQLGAAAHFAVVRHEVCAEHGELVHPDGGVHAAAPRGASAFPALTASEARGGHGHDHCVVVGTRRQALAASRAEFTCLERDDGRVLPSAALAPPPCEARFRLAPKQSPPA
jgi:hypothetical protein